MRKLLFFSRVAFICNLCFLLALLLRYVPSLTNSGSLSTLIIMGNVLAIGINTILVLLYITLTISSRSIFQYVPAWLVIINFVFFVLQVIFLIK